MLYVDLTLLCRVEASHVEFTRQRALRVNMPVISQTIHHRFRVSTFCHPGTVDTDPTAGSMALTYYQSLPVQ